MPLMDFIPLELHMSINRMRICSALISQLYKFDKEINNQFNNSKNNFPIRDDYRLNFFLFASQNSLRKRYFLEYLCKIVFSHIAPIKNDDNRAVGHVLLAFGVQMQKIVENVLR